tara:strand:+ start:3229 stop:3459 length:231 start_codon:yes stop_codon:yes gene_type:complete
VSATAPSFAVPAEQALRVELLQTPSTGAGPQLSAEQLTGALPSDPAHVHVQRPEDKDVELAIPCVQRYEGFVGGEE